jgi:EmrB/QacA subfamily drug resistance transporter
LSKKTWILVAAVIGSGIVFLDSTVVNIALPEIGRDLESDLFGVLEGQSYIYYGYLLSLSALLILAGALADFFGRKRLFVIGLVGFGVTSVMCGLAPNLDLLILARVLQGAAGAILVPGSLAIISSCFDGEEEGRAFGVWAGASAATTIFGPALGGFLVSAVSWRAVFLINVPLILFGLWVTARHVPESRDESAHGRFHWSGAIAIAIAVGGLTFGAIRGEAQDWSGAEIYVSLGLGALALVAAPIMMMRARNPLIPPKLFRSRNFTVTNISTLVIYGALYVAFQYNALYMIGTLDYNELGYGLAVIPGSLFLAFFSARFGALAARLGPRIFMTIGPIIMGIGLLWFARIPVDSEGWRPELSDLGSPVPPAGYVVDVLPALAVFGIGLMVMVAPLTTALMRSVPVKNSGVASAVNNAISRAGPQLVGALLFIAIGASFASALESQPAAERASAEAAVEEISPLNAPPKGASEGLADAIKDASTSAFHTAMIVSAGLCFAGAVVNGAGIRNEDLREESPEEASGPESVA